LLVLTFTPAPVANSGFLQLMHMLRSGLR
jgi:hypothetical protein